MHGTDKLNTLPFDNCGPEWVQKMGKSQNFLKEENIIISENSIKNIFFNIFSKNDYKTYRKTNEKIKFKQIESHYRLHKHVSYAMESYSKGQYKAAKKHILNIKKTNINLALEYPHLLQLSKEAHLKHDLEKIKSVKRKINYLNNFYFEISGNVLYNTDLLGVKILLENINKKTKNKTLDKVKKSIQNIYKKTSKFKKDLIGFDSLTIEKELKDLSEIHQLPPYLKQEIGGIHWIIIAKTFSLGHLLSESYKARKTAKEYFIKNKLKFYRNKDIFYLYAYRACLEDNISCKVNGFLFPEKYLVSIAHSYLYLEELEKARFILNNNLSNRDIEFYNYIKNKNIAIVGPVDTGAENGEEIDSHDIVIRLNTYQPSNYPDKIFGKKTNVAYFLRRYYEKLLDNNEIKDAIKHVDYVVYHSNKIDTLHEKSEKYKNTRFTIRYQDRANNFFFSGYGNFIQRIIMDIVRFEPKKIKVFNTNLWLTIKKSEYYIHKQKFSPENIIMHDVLSNFVFTKKMYQNNIIDVDSMLNSILKMTPNDYINEIINKYS